MATKFTLEIENQIIKRRSSMTVNNQEILVQVFDYLKESLELEVSIDEYCVTINLLLKDPSNSEMICFQREQVDIPFEFRNSNAVW